MFLSDNTRIRLLRKKLRAGRVGEAEAALRTWQVGAPGSLAAAAMQAALLRTTGRMREARTLLEKITASGIPCASAYTEFGQVYLIEGKMDEAESCFRRALALAPDEDEAACLLATCRLQAGDVECAERTLLDALTASSEESTVCFVLGELWLGLGLGEEAELLVRTALDREPDAAQGWLVLAIILTARAAFDEAMACTEHALLAAPGNPLLLVRAALLSVQCGCATEAERHARAALTLMPANAMAHQALGEALRGQRKFQEALAAYAVAVRHAPRDPSPVLEIARTQKLRGEFAAARIALERAFSLAPDFPGAHQILGEIHFLEGDIEQAFAANERVDAALRKGMSRAPAPLGVMEGRGRTLVLTASAMQQIFVFARYARPLQDCGVRVAIVVPEGMRDFIGRIDGVAAAIGPDEVPGEAIVEPIIRVPLLAGMERQAWYPGPYGRVEEDRAERYREEFASCPRPWIGVNPGAVPAPDLIPVLREAIGEGVATLFAFTGAETLQALPGATVVAIPDNGDIDEAAALLQVLDTVLTVDSPLAHIAGTIGVPAHVLLPVGHDAIWGTAATTPWYPGLTLYRETSVQGWKDALERLRTEWLPSLAAAQTEATF